MILIEKCNLQRGNHGKNRNKGKTWTPIKNIHGPEIAVLFGFVSVAVMFSYPRSSVYSPYCGDNWHIIYDPIG